MRKMTQGKKKTRMKMIKRQWTKNSKKLMIGTFKQKTKGKAEERPNGHVARKNQKREIGNPSHGRKLSHPQPF